VELVKLLDFEDGEDWADEVERNVRDMLISSVSLKESLKSQWQRPHDPVSAYLTDGNG